MTTHVYNGTVNSLGGCLPPPLTHTSRLGSWIPAGGHLSPLFCLFISSNDSLMTYTHSQGRASSKIQYTRELHYNVLCRLLCITISSYFCQQMALWHSTWDICCAAELASAEAATSAAVEPNVFRPCGQGAHYQWAVNWQIIPWGKTPRCWDGEIVHTL